MVANQHFVLTLSVARASDTSRLLRELNQFDELVNQAKLRPSTTQVKIPTATKQLSELAKLNNCDLTLGGQRQQLIKFLAGLKDQAPIIHFAFASEPSPLFVESLMKYLRKEINPLTLITIGLQPNIAAGCTVRVNSRYFDFSLKERLKKSRGLLVDQIKKELTVT